MNPWGVIGRAIYNALKPTELNQGEQEWIEQQQREREQFAQEPVQHIHEYNDHVNHDYGDHGTYDSGPSGDPGGSD